MSQLAPLFASVLVFAAAESAFNILVPPHLSTSLHLDDATIGVVVATFAASSLTMRVPMSGLYRASWIRPLLVVGGLVSATAMVLAAMAPTGLAFAAVMAINGVGWSISTTTQLAAVIAWRPEGINNASSLGWYAGFAGLGHTSSALSGVVAERLGSSTTFLLIAAFLAIGSLAMAPLLSHRVEAVDPDRARSHGWMRLDDLRALPLGVLAGVAVMFYINFIMSTVRTFQPILGLDAGLSLGQIGVLASCTAFASMSVRLASGPLLVDRDASLLSMPLAGLGAASTFLIPTFASSFVLQVPLFLGIGASRGLLRVTGSAEAFDSLSDDDHAHGVASSVLHSGLDLGKLSGPPVSGVLAGILGIGLMLRLVPIVLLAIYVVLRIMSRRQVARPPVG